MKNILFLDNVNKAIVLFLRITYFLDIVLHLHIAYILKDNYYYYYFFFIIIFYCLVLINPMIISTKCIDLLLCTFKTGHLLLIMMVTDCINQLRKNDYSQTIFNSYFPSKY